ncbi:MAG: radical SAM protein [Planctomycetes bacterium]|nr:radical SAM protein [Planctomycetota bacterium]
MISADHVPSRRPNVLLYTPPSPLNYTRLGRCGGSSKGGERWPPIKLLWMAGAARRHGNVLFIDGDNGGLTEAGFLARAVEFRPDWIVSEPLPNLLDVEIHLLERMKAAHPGVRVVLTGAFASVQHTEILQRHPVVDFVIPFEVEGAIEELLAGKPVLEIPGLYYREGGEERSTGNRPFLKDLDGLAFPAHDLLHGADYFAPFIQRGPFTIVETSRGCPYPCVYCNAHVMNGKVQRYRSPDNVIAEMKWLQEIGIREVYFNDETFTLHHERLSVILDRMIAERIDLTWVCNTRADVVRKDILKKMKAAGCHTIFFGVESGDQRIVDYYRRELTLGQVREAFAACREVGLKTVAHFIFGAPDETEETIRSTIAFAREIKPTLVSFNLLTPYPGTRVHDLLEEEGLLNRKDYAEVDQSRNMLVRSKSLSPERLKEALGEAYLGFYVRPGYILRRFLAVRSWMDLKKILNGYRHMRSLMRR